MSSLLGCQVLCVGGTSGIGEAIAYKFARLSANVTIIGTNATAGRLVVENMKNINSAGSYSMMKGDATSMKGIVRLCEQIKEKHSRLNYMVLTQGMASTSGRQETHEGIDKKLSLHYYGRVLFIRELQSLLSDTAKAGHDVRVMSILSGGVHSPYTIKNDFDLKAHYSVPNAANAAGFYNDLALDRFSRQAEWQGVSFIHAAPGFVRTTWGKDFPFYLRVPLRIAQIFAVPPEICAENMVSGMLSESMKGGFHVMNPSGRIASTTAQHTEEYEGLVWQHTEEIIARALASPRPAGVEPEEVVQYCADEDGAINNKTI